LKQVSEILAKLKKGILSTAKGDKITDKQKLRATISRLRDKAKLLEQLIRVC